MLGPGAAAEVQAEAALALGFLAQVADNQVKIAAAGAISPLVQLLGTNSVADVQTKAAAALTQLALNAENQVIIAAAGAIPPLVQLLGAGSSAGVQDAAAAALRRLACNADNQVTIAAAGAIPPLVQLLVPGATARMQQFAASAICCACACTTASTPARAPLWPASATCGAPTCVGAFCGWARALASLSSSPPTRRLMSACPALRARRASVVSAEAEMWLLASPCSASADVDVLEEMKRLGI
ncbi:hypothetical protein FOA52_002508 [Chlamydomonas sp. UWO 241]|nr:hypothetical protein FOA52_002508 [Chlamydomonas sp. UWO 241]